MRNKAQPIYMISIDPASHGSGVALWQSVEPNWESWRLLGSIAAPKGTDQLAAILLLESLFEGRVISDEEACILVVEDWRIQRSRAAVESLAASQRMWIDAVVRVFGNKSKRVKVVKLNSQTWMSRSGVLAQKKVLGSTKAVTAALAADMCPGLQMTEDQADAIVMGNWWLQAGALAGHEKRKDERKQRQLAERAKRDSAGSAAIRHFRQMGLL